MRNFNLKKVITLAVFTGLLPLSAYADICRIVELKFENRDYEKISDFSEEDMARYERYKKKCNLKKYKTAEDKYQKENAKKAKKDKEEKDFIKDRETETLTMEDIRGMYDNSPVIAYRATIRYDHLNQEKKIYLQQASDANIICKDLLDDPNARAKTVKLIISEKERLGAKNTPEIEAELEKRFELSDEEEGITINKAGFFTAANSDKSKKVRVETELFETSKKDRLEFNSDLRVMRASGLPSTISNDVRALEISELECSFNPENSKDKQKDLKTEITIKTKVKTGKIDADEDEQMIKVRFDAQEYINMRREKGKKGDDTTINDIKRGQHSEVISVDDQIDFILEGRSRAQ